MALIDNQLMFSDVQDLTATANSTNVVDFGTGRNLGSGSAFYLLFQFGTVVSNATWQANFTADTVVGFGSKITVASTKTITPVSNTYYVLPIPPMPLRQFARIEYTLTGGASPHIPTSATFVLDPEKHLYLAGAAALY